MNDTGERKVGPGEQVQVCLGHFQIRLPAAECNAPESFSWWALLHSSRDTLRQGQDPTLSPSRISAAESAACLQDPRAEPLWMILQLLREMEVRPSQVWSARSMPHAREQASVTKEADHFLSYSGMFHADLCLNEEVTVKNAEFKRANRPACAESSGPTFLSNPQE